MRGPGPAVDPFRRAPLTAGGSRAGAVTRGAIGPDPVGAGDGPAASYPRTAQALRGLPGFEQRGRTSPGLERRTGSRWRGCGLSAHKHRESQQLGSGKSARFTRGLRLRLPLVGPAPSLRQGRSAAPHFGLFVDRTLLSPAQPGACSSGRRPEAQEGGTIPANRCRRCLIRCGESSIIGARCRTAALARGVIGNTPDSGSGESRFEPWRANRGCEKAERRGARLFVWPRKRQSGC